MSQTILHNCISRGSIMGGGGKQPGEKYLVQRYQAGYQCIN